MRRNPCLWKSLQSLNMKVSFSDLISVFDFQPEWFCADGTCLEAVRAPLQRLGFYISHIPVSLLPHHVMNESHVINESEKHLSKYLFWRKNHGIGHYAHKFKPGDLCFEITNYPFLPGDLSWVFGSAKEKKGIRTWTKDPALSQLTTLPMRKDSSEAVYSGGHNHIEYTYCKGGCSDIVDRGNILLELPQPDNLHVLVYTHDQQKIRLWVNLKNTVFQVRKKISDILCVPLNQWRLLSSGGRLLWDTCKLADYDIKDQQTLNMWLLLKGAVLRLKGIDESHLIQSWS